MLGRIKRLERDRGFGFVTGEDAVDRFWHVSELNRVRFDELQEGDWVIFDPENTARGPRAVNLFRA